MAVDQKQLDKAIAKTEELRAKTEDLIATRDDLTEATKMSDELLARNAELAARGLERQLTALEQITLRHREEAKAITAKRQAIIQNIKALDEEFKALERVAEKTTDPDQLAAIDAQQNAIEDLILEYESLEDAIREAAEAAEDLANQSDRFASATKGIAEGLMGALGISTKFEETMLGKFDQLRADGVGFGETIKGVTEQMKSMNFGSALSVSILSKFAEASIAVTLAVEKATTSFNAATGAAGKFDAQIQRTERRLVMMGVTAQESATAVQSLFTDFKGFTELSKESSDQAMELTAVLAEIGVEAGITSNLFNVYTKAMGMSFDEAEGSIRQAVGAAEALDIPLNQFMSDMNSALPQLTMFGKESQRVFTDLQAVVKSTGIETNALMGLFQQYDTFEGAATAAGKLNSVLGGMYINTLDLVHAEPAEKFRLMQQALAGANKDFDNLTRRERQAIATAAGINDMAVASQLFGGQLGSFDQYQQKTAAAAKSQEELMQAAKDVQPFLTKLLQLISLFGVVFTPVLKALSFFVDMIATAVTFIKDLAASLTEASPVLGGIAATIMILAGAFFGLGLATAVAAGKARLIATVLLLIASYILQPLFSPPLYIGIYILSGGVKALGTSSAASAPSIATLGVALVKVGLAVSAVVGSIALLALAMSDMTNTQIIGLIAVLGLLGAAMVVLGTKGVAAAPGIAALGVSLGVLAAPFAAMALSIAAVIGSVALLVGAFSLLVNGLGNLVVKLSESGTSIVPFAGALGLIALSAIPASIGIGFLAIAFGALGLSMLLIGTDKTNAVARLFESLAKVNATANSIREVTKAVKEFALAADGLNLDNSLGIFTITTAIKSLGDEDLTGLQGTAEGFGTMLEAAKTIPPDAPEAVASIVDQAVRYKQEAILEKEKESTVSIETLLEKVTQVTQAPGMSAAPMTGPTGDTVVVLSLNERELGRAVLNNLNKKQRVMVEG
jgi:hypothetical protein